MQNATIKKIFSLLLVLTLLVSLAPHIPVTAQDTSIRWKESDQTVTLDRSDRLANIDLDTLFAPTDMVRVSIVLKEKSTIEAGFSTLDIASDAQAMSYNQKLLDNQITIQQRISTQVLDGAPLDVVWNLTLVGNIISANVPYGAIARIRKLDGVAGVVLENMYEPAKPAEDHGIVPNQSVSGNMIGSSLVWTNGYTGAGSRIAVIDTGTDTDHQSFDNGAFLYALEQNALAAGMTTEAYMASLQLLSQEEVAEVLPYLNIYERDNTLTAQQLYLNEKLAFAVNYVDAGEGRLNVTHDFDFQSAHGSHVAGIATANRFIFRDGTYVDAMQAVQTAGVAPDAQLITMKVFGNTALRDSDYMAAIEDAILLGCDSVNLSLGTVVSGFAFNDYYAQLLDFISKSDTVVVASAGNEGQWTAMTMFGVPYSDDVTYNMVGSPGSYASFFTVASVENDGVIGMIFRVGDLNVMYTEETGYGNAPLASIDTSANGTGTVYEYVFTDGMGYSSDYAGIDLTGKIVFCSRGDLNFYEKANNAVQRGAAAVIVYNNTEGGFRMNLAGYSYSAPCVSVSQEVADYIRSISTAQTTAGGVSYYTGAITIFGSPQAGMFNSQYYTMSSFSSWGVPGDLSIKPEITAPGGLIYSVYGSTPELSGTDQYGLMSGTSMAAPQVAGMVALLSQYLQANGLAAKTGLSPRVLAHSLLMSTSVPMLEATSNSYYPIMQQGAGLARVDLATLAKSYILVDGQPDGKVKAELGDDPDRTGEYRFSFDIHNLTGTPQDYTLNASLFRQGIYDPGEANGEQAYGFMIQDPRTVPIPSNAVFTVDGQVLVTPETLAPYDLNGDGITDANDADFLLEYLVGNEAQLQGQGDINGDGQINTYDAHYLLAMLTSASVVTVPADGTVTVEVVLTLTDEAKATLDRHFQDGVLVQGYVFANEITDDEAVQTTDHSIPLLAFYGNWTDPNMFDRGTYVEMMYGISDLIPYLYQVIGNGNALTIDYGDGEEFYFGGNPILQDEAYIAARNAFNSEDNSYLKAQYFTLIRNAGQLRIQIVDKQTGEIYHSADHGQYYPAFYNENSAQWENTEQGANVFWYGTDANGDPLPDGTVVQVIATALPEYYRGEDGNYDYTAAGHGASMVTEITIDNQSPTASDMALDLQDGFTLSVTARDNQYVAAVMLLNKSGSIVLASTPGNQTTANTEATFQLDLNGITGSKFLLAVYDYAGNVTTYDLELDLPQIERPYFTVVDYQQSIYYGIDAEGNAITLGTGDRGLIMAAEFVDGHVFEVAQGGKLYVANDNDLYSFQLVSALDPGKEWAITNFLDLAYNYADDKLYGLFYSEINGEAQPLLCTIDMLTGQMDVLLEMPMDVNNMAIDGEGNFYSVAYDTTYLYTYTLESLENYEMTYIGEVGYYHTGSFNSLAWDHNTDKLYWAYPNTLLEVNPETAEPTLLSYFNFSMVGLYIRPETYDDTRFDPTDRIVSVELDYTENRVFVQNTLQLTATVRPWNVTNSNVIWTSDNEAVATVDENGLITGVSAGVVTITATSALDPTKSASCVVEVAQLDKTLNALIWDTDGKIWWTEFNINNLPNYFKLQDTPVEEYLASTTFAPDGTLYAASTDLSTGTLESALFTVDPDTFALTKIGDSNYGYSDIAYAPHIHGGAIMGTYGQSLLVVDPTTGQAYADFTMFMYGLCAISYAGSDRYQDYGFDTYIDWFFLIDTHGFVYLLGFLEDADGNLYYLDHPATEGGIFTVVNYMSDVIYFSSAHYDGNYLYWSVYNKSKDMSTLFVIDTVGSRKAYQLGNFGLNVWPAGGLCELERDNTGMSVGNSTAALIPQAIKSVGLDRISDPVQLTSTGKAEAEEDRITVQITAADVATNGTVQLTYDPAKLQLATVSGVTQAFAYSANNGVLTIAFADAAALEKDAVIATVEFAILVHGDNHVTIRHGELNQGVSDKVEEVTIHTHVAEILPGKEATCTETGLTEGKKCSVCGEVLVAQQPTPAKDHNYENGSCTECGEADPDYDVQTVLLGDLNMDGKVNSADVNLLYRYVYGDETLKAFTAEQMAAADANQDGNVNSADVSVLYRYAYGDATLTWKPKEIEI